MFDFEKRHSDFGRQTVLCIGDLMLDDFVYGDVSRISPEAPAPVIRVSREDVIVGGAGNVARNIASLGARCLFVGVVGDDSGGKILRQALAGGGRTGITARLVVDRFRPTTRKLRFVSEHFSTHLLRADWEMAKPVGPAIEAALIRQALALIPKAGAVVLSDYAKGVLTPRLVGAVIARASKLGKPVIVDPKGNDFSIYRGATIITPNRKELADATRRTVESHAELAAAAKALGRAVRSEAVLVTLSEDGMMLHAGGKPVHVPAYSVKVRDVSGAGDTVAATLAVMLAAGADYESAMRAANAAASVVVGKSGTATVSGAELRARILPSATLAPEQKIVSDWRELEPRLTTWRGQDLRIGFTNGVFDLLHPGHIKVLAQSRATCDRLVVGLNSDKSVKRLKGKDRPIQNERARAEVLAGLEAVDLVVIFGQDTPLELIRRVRPNVLVKGGDYRRDQVVGRELVEAQGGQVVLVDLVPGFSTTRIVERSRSRKKR